MPRSFADPETSFELVVKPNGKPTGLVRCPYCRNVALDLDWIPHSCGCEQEGVHSEWWRETHDGP